MSWKKMRDEPERMKLDHFSLDRSEIFKATELTGKQRYVHSMLKVEAPPTYFEIHLNNLNHAHNLHKLHNPLSVMSSSDWFVHTISSLVKSN